MQTAFRILLFTVLAIGYLLLMPHIHVSGAEQPEVSLRPATLPADENTCHGALWIALSESFIPWLKTRASFDYTVVLFNDEGDSRKFKVEVKERVKDGTYSWTFDLILDSKHPAESANKNVRALKGSLEAIFSLREQLSLRRTAP
jgi:hypothetical protein